MGNITKSMNFRNGDHVLSSPDLIAVKAGLKRTTRVECESPVELKSLYSDFSKHNLKMVCSGSKMFGVYNVYVARTKALAERAKKVDPTFKIYEEKKIFSESIDYVKEYSYLLNYPVCCFENYLDNINNKILVSNLGVFNDIPDKIDFRFNNLLNGITNYYISFHSPCSYECKNSDKYQRDIFSAVEELSPEYAEKLKYMLSNPFLVVVKNVANSAYKAWDQRVGLIFDGKFGGDVLRYDKYVFFQTAYRDYDNSNNNELLEKFIDANSNSINRQDFFVDKNKKNNSTYEENEYCYYLLNFK